MFAFLRKNQIVITSCFCVVLSFYILTAASRGHLKNDPVGPVLLWLFRPLQIGAEAAAAWVRDVQENFASVSGLRNENERLRSRIQELEVERNRLLEAEATNRRLQELLDFRTQVPAAAITASIIANSASTWFHSCLLDKGSADGVRRGMAVVTPAGVLGRVVSVTSRTAKVLLLTDPNSGVDVVVQRTRARGIVSGSLEDGTLLKYVKRTEDIQEGDRLVTSGVDGIFPKGLLVGTVVKVRKQSLGLFQHVEVLPAIVTARAEEVLVVSGRTDSR
jgi:rod shape-determining protein MreC